MPDLTQKTSSQGAPSATQPAAALNARTHTHRTSQIECVYVVSLRAYLPQPPFATQAGPAKSATPPMFGLWRGGGGGAYLPVPFLMTPPCAEEPFLGPVWDEGGGGEG